MPDLSFCFFLQSPVESVEFFVVIYIPVLDGMDEIKIKKTCSRSLQLGLKNAVAVPFCFQFPSGKLGSQHIGISRISLYKRFAHGDFGFSVVIRIGGIKIIEPGFHIHIHHAAYLIDDNLAVLFGEAHHTKSQFRHFFQINRHTTYLPIYKI